MRAPALPVCANGRRARRSRRRRARFPKQLRLRLATARSTSSRYASDKVILRDHEKKILRSLASGLTYSEIERALWYAPDSPRVEIGRAIRRNRARNRTHLLALSIRAGALNLNGHG
jgi:DNA-binding CsgD family transcriptional regulator